MESIYALFRGKMSTSSIEEAVVTGHNILILGAAGTGKSFLVKKLFNTLKTKKTTQLTASTGIAASNIEGVTIHKFMGLLDGRYHNEEITTKIINEERFLHVKERLQKVECIIIDEISMLSLKTFLQIEYILRGVKQNSLPFGGVQIILSGDFFQLKPVANPWYNNPGDLVISYNKFSDLVPHHFILTEVFRQKEGMP